VSDRDLTDMVSWHSASSRGRTRHGVLPLWPASRPVTWRQPGPKPVLIIGVYPSAVHARWIGPDAKGIRALAVADEPEPFWTGDGAETTVATVAATVPAEAGRIELAKGHNGRSGRALDKLMLEPLALTRDKIRVADIDNRYMANLGQQDAVAHNYVPLVERGILPPATWRPRRAITRVPSDRSPALADEVAEADPAWIITLGDEPLRSLDLEPLTRASYGTPLPAVVLGNNVQLLRLVHTRQQAGHGPSSSDWAEAHRQWCTGDGAAAVGQMIMADLGH
jgi:hypothetical protein